MLNTPILRTLKRRHDSFIFFTLLLLIERIFFAIESNFGDRDAVTFDGVMHSNVFGGFLGVFFIRCFFKFDRISFDGIKLMIRWKYLFEMLR